MKKIKFKKDLYSYDLILKSFEYNILIQVDEPGYQGDSLVLFHDKEKDKFGFLVFGWGSCSGCDALASCNSQEDLDELQSQLLNSIKWFEDINSAADYFKNKDWKTEHYYSTGISETFMEKFNHLKIVKIDEILK